MKSQFVCDVHHSARGNYKEAGNYEERGNRMNYLKEREERLKWCGKLFCNLFNVLKDLAMRFFLIEPI